MVPNSTDTARRHQSKKRRKACKTASLFSQLINGATCPSKATAATEMQSYPSQAAKSASAIDTFGPRMIEKAILFATVMLIHSAIAFGQEVGTQEAYRAWADSQRMLAEQEMRWNSAKKLYPAGERAPVNQKPTKQHQLDPQTMKVGDKGRLDAIVFNVTQVMPDERQTLLRAGPSILLSNYDVSELVSDSHVVLMGWVQVGKPYTYTTVIGGTNTVNTIEFIAAEDARKIEAELTQKKINEEFPTWTSRTGSTVQAKFIRYFAGRAELETTDGRKLRVALTDFNQADSDRIRELVRRQNEESEKKSRGGDSSGGFYGPGN